jgi:hypothetical protein
MAMDEERSLLVVVAKPSAGTRSRPVHSRKPGASALRLMNLLEKSVETTSCGFGTRLSQMPGWLA